MVTGVGTAKRLAVVTGANKGIGFHIASQLLEANHRVILACRSEELGRAAAKALGGDCDDDDDDAASDEDDARSNGSRSMTRPPSQPTGTCV